MYDYLYGSGFLIPRIHTRLLAENLRHAHRVGFTDYYAEVYAHWGLHGPMPWLAARLLQDPEQPEAVLLDEYYRRYFREAAGPMRQFFARCEEIWMAQTGQSYWLKHFRNQSQAVVFSPAAIQELRGVLDTAFARTWSGKTRARVEQVSAAFGVTERFIAFEAARDRLKRLALRGESSADGIRTALTAYREARREFIHYTLELQRSDPLAVRRFGWDDYLKDDPGPLAEFAIALAADPGSSATASAEPTLQLLRNPGLTGLLKPARIIAGLPYGIPLPAEWQSRVEPSQFHRTQLFEVERARGLRVSGTKDTIVSQWIRLGVRGAGSPENAAVSPAGSEPGETVALYRAAIAVRGRVSPGNAVSLVFSWLDGLHRHVGFRTVRLPDGEWPEWVTLRQAGEPPAGAEWVGLGLRVQHQLEGDWVEAKDFSVLR
jgi:hypothetical protein